MAIGTITLSKGSGEPTQNLYVDQISFTGDASYLAGGMALKDLFQAAAVDSRLPIAIIAGACGGYVPVYVPSTGKLMVYWGDNNNASDGPLIEVPDTTDLHTITFNLTVLSQ